MKKHFMRRANMRLVFTVLIMVELILVTTLSWVVMAVFHEWFSITLNLPIIIWLLIMSSVIGGAITNFISKQFFEPITRLGNAMSQVAQGDFTVHIESDACFKEIGNIYANFNLMTQELKTTEILQTDFVSNVSHEFKTPINAIEGYATLLQNDEPDDSNERMRYVEKILLNTRRLSNLVGNILLLSKVDNQAIPMKSITFRLDEQIRQTVVMLEPEWAPKDIEFDVELDQVKYTGPESLMTHIWSNLIGNAIKFDPEGGVIRMRLKKRKNNIIFTIEDNGPGIDESVKRHIFDQFYQGDSSHKQEGNGLGLALVKRILSVCNGEISVRNLPEGGCQFTVSLTQ